MVEMAIEMLGSLSDERLDAYARLTEAQLRNKLEPEKGIFIAESYKVIERALTAGFQPQSFLMEEKWIDSSRPLFERIDADVPIFVLPTSEIESLTGFELTRGILAAFSRPSLPPVEDVLADARRVAVLDGIVDHTNVGAAFRSAAALGVDAVLVTPTCCDPWYRRAVRVSMGTVFQIPWTRIGGSVGDWPDAGFAKLHEAGFLVAALALSNTAIELGDPCLAACEKLAMIFGTEGDGLSKEVITQSDFTVKIPMAHGVDSLNVAAASAVTFWELCR